MRKIILSNMVTLDGYMEGPNQSIDWHHVDADFFDTANELMDSVDTHLYGRVTYQGMESYWTTEQAMKDDPVITVKMNETPKDERDSQDRFFQDAGQGGLEEHQADQGKRFVVQGT